MEVDEFLMIRDRFGELNAEGTWRQSRTIVDRENESATQQVSN